MGPKEPSSTVLTSEEEHTLLSLDDCLYALKISIPIYIGYDLLKQACFVSYFGGATFILIFNKTDMLQGNDHLQNFTEPRALQTATII